MNKQIIKVQQLAKQYRIGASQGSYQTLRDSIAEAVKAPFRQKRNGEELTIWALKDVNFEIAVGEVVGIIGPNGAGKSTLLKILSRITEPTIGRVELYGRVGSLLEVGTGFHPELTGRENITLNGVILGMGRKEIRRKFDEIVSFAEVEKFIDTPVKHYSSGMYLRLAFAVAAHLEPEILMVDEVLAVGDARFQRKCLDKMQDVGNQGHTILFVSHSMSAITRLCPRTILLDRGRVLSDGPSHEVASDYLSELAEDGEVHDVMDIRKPIAIEMEFVVLQGGHELTPNYHFYNEQGVHVFVAGDNDPAWFNRPRPRGRFASTVRIPGNLLAEGTMLVGAAVTTREPEVIHFFERDAVAFEVVDSMDGDSVRGGYGGHIPGVVRPKLEWDTRYTSDQRDTVADVALR